MGNHYDALLAKLDKQEDRKQFTVALSRKIGDALPTEPLSLAGQAAAAIRQLIQENAELSAPKKRK